MSDEETISKEVSPEGIKACGRVDAALKALDREIAALEASKEPKDQDRVKAAAAFKPPPSSAGAQQNSADHTDHYFKNLAISVAERKLLGETSVHNRIDREMDMKYSAPLEQKVKYAKALGIGKLKVNGQEIGLEPLADNARKDIDLAKATASLVAEGHSTLNIPRYESNPAEKQRGCEFASAIIVCANDVRQGKPPRYEAKPELVMPPAPPPVYRRAARNTRSGLQSLMTTVNVEDLSAAMDDAIEENPEAESENTNTGKPARRVSAQSARLIGAFNPAVVLTPQLGGSSRLEL